MITVKQVDVIILGAGIAGLSVADAVQVMNKSCAIIDRNPQGNGTSSSPGMLINPATGRRAKKSWKFNEGYQSILNLIQQVEQYSSEIFYEKNGVVRPALTKKIAKDFRKSPEKYNWERGWLEWLEKDLFNKQFPHLGENFGGLFINKGITLDGAEFNQQLINYLSQSGVQFLFNSKPLITKELDEWLVNVDGVTFSSHVLIDATGSNQAESKEWDFLPLHKIKGQTATYFFSEELPLNTSVSGLGYLAYLSNRPEAVIVGSTYEHNFKYTEPDNSGLDQLNEKLKTMLPGYFDKIESVKQWAGIRVTLPDKKPVIGEHPFQKNHFIIGALGSKGLLLGRYLAELLVNHIFFNTEISESVSIKRLL